MNDDVGGYIFIGFIIGFIISALIACIFAPNAALSQETMDEICVHITNNTATEAEIVNQDWKARGDLSCKVPTYDHTQRIIVEKNNK